uniref:Uncharacterized protein n=1 Tax=Romanomermis culicivorax TaxID=13658 RepID=A0A915L393_ROMCU
MKLRIEGKAHYTSPYDAVQCHMAPYSAVQHVSIAATYHAPCGAARHPTALFGILKLCRFQFQYVLEDSTISKHIV